jgi:Domain of unknown function (DU1801)
MASANYIDDPVEQVRNSASPENRVLYDSLKALVFSIHRNAFVIAWPKQRIISFGVGPKKMSQHYVYIGLQSTYVNLGFYKGVLLNDPASLLEGTGKELRHVKIRNLDIANSPALKDLICAALSERMPYA